MHVEIESSLLPSFAPDWYTQDGLCYVPSLHVHFTVESCIAIWITDVQNFCSACYIPCDAFTDGKSFNREQISVTEWLAPPPPPPLTLNYARSGQGPIHTNVFSSRRKRSKLFPSTLAFSYRFPPITLNARKRCK